MKNIKYICIIVIFNCLLSACSSNFTTYDKDLRNVINNNQATENTRLIVDKNDRVVRKLGGSNVTGEKLFNSDKSLSCSLKSWELIGVFVNEHLRTTQGEFVFEITNHAPKDHNWVIFELLILDEKGNVQITSNPFRDLQGESIQINPPIEQGQTRTLVRGWKYRIGWHDVTLKSCQWTNSGADYFEKYPELKNHPIP